MSEEDKKNAEDMVIIAVELLYEVKIYDYTVFNPINFIIICMCEHAIQYFPESVRISQWLLKMYSKLGCASIITDIADKFPETNDTNTERIGATRFSVYADYGMSEQLEELVQEYKDFFNDKINENKNNIVTSFVERDFDKIHPLM